MKNEIYELLEWINKDLTDYVEYFDNVESKIRFADNI